MGWHYAGIRDETTAAFLREGRFRFIYVNYVLYDAITSAAAPIGAVYLACSRRHRALLARFRPAVPPGTSRPLWVHACSVGEVAVARPLIAGLQRAWPDVPVILTCSTRTGHAQALRTVNDVPITWFPFDQALSVRGFFARLQPRMLILIETELWPNVLREAMRRQVPAAVVNGRISDRHLPRYRRLGSLGRAMFANLQAVGAQSERYAGRFVELGTPPEAVRVTGNIKFDGVPLEVEADRLAEVRAACNLTAHDPILVFGSTRPGDEERAASCWRALRSRYPGLRLVIAPRHVERADEVAAMFPEGVVRRSHPESRNNDSGVVLVDTLGELGVFYALATVAVVGGSFSRDVNGHNPLEPAALGVPTVFGPCMGNFQEAADGLAACGGALRVPDGAGLEPALGELLGDDDGRTRMGVQGRAFVESGRGALARTLEMLGALVG